MHSLQIVKQSFSKKNLSHKGVLLATVHLSVLTTTLLATEAIGQSLDDVQSSLLQNSCQVLKGSTLQQQIEFFAYAGTQLSFLCDPATGGGVGGAGVASSSGGGAASTQNQFVAITKRLSKLRGSKDEQSQNGGGSGDEFVSDLGGGLNVFLSGQFEGLDRNTTHFETGYKSNINGVTTGADYRFNDWLVSGLAFNYNNWNGQFNTLGGFDTNSLGPIFYTSFSPTDNSFADIVLEYTHQWRDRARFTSFADSTRPNHNASGLADSDYESNRLGANALLGYDYHVGSFTIGPRFRFRYSDLNINQYTETGSTGLEMRFLNDRITSLQTAVGLQASAAVSTNFGVIVPQVTADWTHEFQNNQRAMYAQFAQDGRPVPTTLQFLSDRPDRDFFHLGTGVAMILPNGIQPFVNFEALVGNNLFNHYVGTVGIRLEL